MRLSTLAPLVVLVRIAAAQSERGSITAGFVLDASTTLNAALAVEGTVRIPSTFLAVRVMAARGVAVGESAEVGPFRRGGVGLEARACSAASVAMLAGDSGCGFLGVDAGYETQHFEILDPGSATTFYDSSGAVLGIRGGAHITRSHLVGRIGFTGGWHHEHKMSSTTTWTAGAGLEMELGYRF